MRRGVRGWTKRRADLDFAISALAEPHWSALAPSRPLRRFRLIEVELAHGVTSAPLRIDERILHYLAGVNLLDGRLQPMLRIARRLDWIDDEHRQLAELGAARAFR